MHRRLLTLLCCLGLTAVAVPLGGARATVPELSPIRTIHTGPDLYGGDEVPTRGGFDTHSFDTHSLRKSANRLRIGKTKLWSAVDDLGDDEIYFKRYRLRGKGEHVEVWVADDSDEISTGLRFPEGDCRNDERVVITDLQVQRLVRQFDRNIYPKESRVFSKPPDRNGSDALLYSPRYVSPPFPRGYFRGQGDNIVVLVDNVRDDAFYDTDNEDNLPYIAGFFYSVFNDFHDRNVMTIDAYDWLHRTGPNPPDQPVPGDDCASKPARPNLYESTFAHEYQHLLEHYEDPFEVAWVNEGLSDWAQSLTGYANPRLPITETGYDSHIQCFLGWLEVQTAANPNPRSGGPENSLNLWEDQENEILCDYGAAYSMMEMLRHRHGRSFMGALHRHDADGLQSLDRLLRRIGSGHTAMDVVHDWSVMAALDGVLDDGATLSGGDAARFSAGNLDATVNWDNSNTYSEPGAPPNGADFVRLRDASGAYLSGDEIESISFDGLDRFDDQRDEDIEDFAVQLIAYDDAHTVAAYTRLVLGSGFTGRLEGAELDAFLPDDADVVAAIVTFDEPTESIGYYAPYVLEVNGVTQPGG